MDEPLSNLDALLRLEMRAELKRLLAEIKATTIYVTHDQIEALSMGDRIAVMQHGAIQQCDHPTKVYDLPTNHFVGSFIGNPPMNFMDAQVQRNNGDGRGGHRRPHADPPSPHAGLCSSPTTASPSSSASARRTWRRWPSLPTMP